MSKLETRVIQVTNVAPSTSKEQLKTLFGFLGRIRDCKVFPPDGSDQQVTAKVCYVEFEDATSAGVSLHLTNTVFIDRALIVVPVMDGKIPDERVAMQLTPQHVSRMAPGQPAWPANVVSQLSGIGINQVITTYDPRLNALGLPQYPPLPASLDAAHVEEIRRTVYVSNLDPKTPPDSLIAFFSQVGEVKYVRMAGEDTLSSRSAFIEFTDQRSVATCLTYNGVVFSGRSLTITHARSNIVKPLSKSQEASRREVEEAMKKVKEAQSLISAAAGEKSRSRSRSRRKSHSRSRAGSRSRSRSRRRSRSRSKGRRRRSRSRGRRSRSPRRIRRSKSRSPHRRGSRSRRSKSKERRRSRSKSKPRHRTRSRSRSRRRSRTPPRAYSSRRSHSRSRGRKSRSKSRPRSRSRDKDGIRAKDRSKDKDKSRDKERDRSKDTEKDKDIEKKKEPEEKKKSGSRSPSPPTLEREGSAVLHSDDEGSPAKLELSSKGKPIIEKTKSEEIADKKVPKPRERSKSPVPIRSSRRRSISRSPVRIQRRRSGSRGSVRTSRRRSITPKKIRRSKSRSPRRSRSPLKKKKPRSRSRSRRSRSGSHHRPKKDKKKEKERSRSRERKEKEKERERERKKKSSRDKKDDKEKPSKVVRDYDEEEKGYNSGSDPETQSRAEVDEEDDIDEKSNEDHRLEDMEMSD